MNHMDIWTPFNQLHNFEPGIIHIIDQYTTKHVLNRFFHHWLYALGLSQDIDRAFACACRSTSNMKTITDFVHQGANVKAKNNLALRWAAEYGHIETVRYLVTFGVDVQCANNYAMVKAIKNRHCNLIKYLTPFQNKRNYNDAVHMAIKYGHWSIIIYMLSAIENDYIDSSHVLEMACSAGKLNVIKYVVETLHKEVHENMMEKAAVNGHIYIVRYLNNKGVKVPLHLLAKVAGKGHVDVARYLVSKGVNVHGDTPQNDCSPKPLRSAVHNGRFEMVKYLITAGARLRHVDYYVEWAFRYGLTHIAEYLLITHETKPRNIIFD